MCVRVRACVHLFVFVREFVRAGVSARAFFLFIVGFHTGGM